MNAVARQTEFVPSSEPRRHRFTLRELLAIQDTGILGEGRVELIDGEIIHMPADGELHRSWTRELNRWLANHLDEALYAFLPNATAEIEEGWAPSPDFYIYPAELTEAAVHGPQMLLVIEQADSSLGRDLGPKAALYASHGVRDYWVIDLNEKRLHIHRDPSADGYRSVQVFEREQPVEALLIPGFSLRLADLPRVG